MTSLARYATLATASLPSTTLVGIQGSSLSIEGLVWVGPAIERLLILDNMRLYCDLLARYPSNL